MKLSRNRYFLSLKDSGSGVMMVKSWKWSYTNDRIQRPDYRKGT